MNYRKLLLITGIMIAAGLLFYQFMMKERSPQTEEIGDPYSGKDLKIGVIGKLPKKNFANVELVKAEPEELKQPKLDAYFITPEYFQWLSQEGWKPTFKEMKTPVFFLNTRKDPLIFKSEHMDYSSSNLESTSHTSGFGKKPNGEEISWSFGDSPQAKSGKTETPESIYHSLFRTIEEYWETYGEKAKGRE